MRVAPGDLAVQVQRAFHVAVQPGLRSGQMRALALAGARGVPIGVAQGVGQCRQRVVAASHHQAGCAQAMRSDEVGPRAQHRLDERLWVTLPRVQQLERHAAGFGRGGIVEFDGGLWGRLHEGLLVVATSV